MLKSRKEALIFVIDVKTFYLPFCSCFAGYQLHHRLGNDRNGNFHLHSIGISQFTSPVSSMKEYGNINATKTVALLQLRY